MTDGITDSPTDRYFFVFGGGRTVGAVVTAMPGGAADKAGNRYERLWIVSRVWDLLEGKV